MEHPVLGLVGLSGARVLRADQPVRPARGLQVLRRRLPSGRASASSSTGCPATFPKDEHGLARFDGTALYEHADPRQGEHQDWGTLDLQLRPQRGAELPAVERALLARGVSRRRPARRRGRVDALPRLLAPARASGFRTATAAARTSTPSSFLQQLNTLTHGEHPGTITAAEESTAWPGVSRPVHLGGLGFTYKWNMGWMHDMLRVRRTGSGAPPLGSTT